MECKKGYVHNFAWFEIQSKKMCINCGTEESWIKWFQFLFLTIFHYSINYYTIPKDLLHGYSEHSSIKEIVNPNAVSVGHDE